MRNRERELNTKSDFSKCIHHFSVPQLVSAKCSDASEFARRGITIWLRRFNANYLLAR